MSQKGADKTTRMSRNKSVRGNLKRHPSFQTKLQDMKEVKKLHISEEKFSYYDEYKTFELGQVKTLKPQFMYDAALARKKDEERESRERFEDIRRRFWKKWAPASDEVKPQKILDRGKSKLRPFDMDIMKASSPEKEAVLRETSAMYRENVNRAGRDAIEFASHIQTPSYRMKRLSKLLKSLNTRIEMNETKASHLFVQCSETSSLENVREWIKHLKPFGSVPKVNNRISISARRARTSIPVVQIKTSRGLSGSGRRKVKTARDPKAKRRRPKTKSALLRKALLEKPTIGRCSLSLHENYSVISLEQLLSYAASPVHSDSATVVRRKVNAAKKALELKDEIEMVKNLPMNIFPEAPESKLSCKPDPFQVDPTPNKHWQERRLYYRKQKGVDYDINYRHPCLQRLCYVPPKNTTTRRH